MDCSYMYPYLLQNLPSLPLSHSSLSNDEVIECFLFQLLIKRMFSIDVCKSIVNVLLYLLDFNVENGK